MNEVKRPTATCALGLGHFLFLSSLFWAAGVHEQTAETFLGLPLFPVPIFSQKFVQGVVYVLGLLSLAVFVDGAAGRDSPWSRIALLALSVVELYFCLVDVRLAGRFWAVLLGLTVVFVWGRRSWLRVAFFVLPATGVWGIGSLLFVPLLARSERKLTGALMIFLFFQGRYDSTLDLTIFGWSLAITLFFDTSTRASRSQLLVGVIGALSASLATWAMWTPVVCEISFEFDSRSHTLIVQQFDKEVELRVDGEKLEGPWYIDGMLIANPLTFASYPERLNSSSLYRAYGRQLQQRYGVNDFRFDLHTAGRATGSKNL